MPGPEDAAPASPAPEGTPPAAEPAPAPQDSQPSGEPPASGAEPPADLTPEEIKKFQEAARTYEQEKPLLETYKEFEKVVAENPELKDAIEGTIKEFVAKRTAQPPQGQQAQVQPNMADPTTQLRMEINYKDYVSQFTQEIASDNLDNEDLQNFFNEVTQVAGRLDPQCLVRHNPELIKRSVEMVRKKWDNIARNRNKAYAATKAKEGVVPPQGAGSAPLKKEPEVMSRKEANSFIASSLKAGHS